MNNEPVAVISAITAAFQATLALVGLFTDISTEALAGLQAALVAWIGVAAAIMRSKVSPVPPATVNDLREDAI